MENGKWKMENGKWKMENGKWKMENGKWKMDGFLPICTSIAPKEQHFNTTAPKDQVLNKKCMTSPSCTT